MPVPRLLPLLLFALVLAVGVRAGDLWAALGEKLPSKELAVALPDAPDAATAQEERGIPRLFLEGNDESLAATEAEPPSLDEIGAGLADIEPAAGGGGSSPPPPSFDETTSSAPDPRAKERHELEALRRQRAFDPLDMSDEEIALLKKLTERREKLELRAREIDERQALLQAAERRIDEKIGDLRDLQSLIDGLLIKHDEQEEAQLRSLVKIYESMKPKEAARIFDELDMVVLLEVIDRMSERRASPILAKMNPARAKQITIELAQRRDLPIPRS